MQTKAHIKATTKYEKNNIDRLVVRLRKDGGYGLTKEDITERAAVQHISVNEYIIQALLEKMEREDGDQADEIERVPIFD